ncbi:TniQ family protein [Shinella sp.]|uniref:TniQ family protein n=1 Tax=Shinella sp. TaxID=1870904 RepID=UPI00289BE29F|nr:TniQ family protein [Shinella sp.]
MSLGPRLSITVTFHSGETVLSFLSRLAGANFAPSAQQFCVHMGISRSKLIQDDEEEIAKLLALAGLSKLPDGHVRVTRDDQFRYFNGEAVPKYNFHRYRFRYCPHCIVDDRRNRPGPLAARAFGRSIWQLLYIKNCPDHDVALVDAPASDLDGTYEIVHMIEAATREPSFLYATPATFTGFERYIRDRVIRQKRSPLWLDRFPLHVAASYCIVVGATITHGKMYRRDNFAEQALSCAEAGFKFSFGGEAALRQHLVELHKDFWEGRSAAGGRVLYGRVYDWLMQERYDNGSDELRQIVREVALSHIPFDPGTVIFTPVTDRRFHTIKSASKQYGFHPVTTRKFAEAAGLIDQTANSISDWRVVMPVEDVDRVMSEVRGYLTDGEARAYLNAERTLWSTITRRGYVKRAIEGSRELRLGPMFSKFDLDDLLSRMQAHVTSNFEDGDHLSSFSETAHRASCKFSEILDLLFAGKLTTVKLDPSTSGISAFRLDPTEVASHTTLPPMPGLSAVEAARYVVLNIKVFTRLANCGVIGSDQAINPVKRCRQRVFSTATLDAFSESYRSLHQLASEQLKAIRVIKRDLDLANVEPAFTRLEVGATFYRKSDLPT